MKSNHAMLVLALLLVVAPLACKTKKSDRMDKLCGKATMMLKKESAGVSGSTFKMMLNNALTACSQGCDDGFKTSCANLTVHLTKICKAAPSVCQGFCKSATAGSSLKTTSCAVVAAN